MKPYSSKYIEKLEVRTVSILRSTLPELTNSHLLNSLPVEIARRIVENAKLVDRRDLRDQILIVLSDYRDHLWAGRALGGEAARMSLADQILEAS